VFKNKLGSFAVLGDDSIGLCSNEYVEGYNVSGNRALAIPYAFWPAGSS
jgi:hypothetical protein